MSHLRLYAQRELYRKVADKSHGLVVAGSLGALSEAFRWPVRDEQDPELRKLADVSLESFLAEGFSDIRMPSSASEKDALGKRHRDLVLRLLGKSEQTLAPLTNHELEALVRASGDDPEAKRLFCLD